MIGSTDKITKPQLETYLRMEIEIDPARLPDYCSLLSKHTAQFDWKLFHPLTYSLFEGIYRTRAIISRGLYFFLPIFH